MAKYPKCMQQVPEIASSTRVDQEQLAAITMIMVRRGIWLLFTVAIVACSSGSDEKGISGWSDALQNKSNMMRTLRRGLPGEPRTLDPQLADDNFSFQVVRDLYEGLTSEDRYGRIVPGAASSWTVDGTGTVYTFQLRPEAKWSNGDRTIAAEFVQGLRRAVDPQTASGSAALLEVIKGASDVIGGRKKVDDLGVSAIGESIVRIQLEHPAPFVLQILSQPIAAPVHIAAGLVSAPIRTGDKRSLFNGAYTLIRRIPGSFIELARNNNYWDSSKVLIDHVRYINVESEATELREYIAGQLDMTFTIPMQDLARVSRKYGAEVQIAPTLGTIYLALDVSEPPLKASKELRQALSMAVDRELISEHLMVGVTPAYSFVAQGISGYDRPIYAWAKWSRDHQLTYARYLYARSGYSQKNPLRLKLYFNSSESIQRIMIAIAEGWKQNLGVSSELISDEFQVFLSGRKARGRWDVARLGWNADYDDPASFLDVFSQSSSQNDPGYTSYKFNELVDLARVEPQPNKRLQLLRESEEILLNDYPIIPVYFYKARRLVKPYLGGAEITPLNRTYSKHLFWQRVS